MPPKVDRELEKIFKLIEEVKNDLKSKASEEKLEELHREIRAKDRKIEILESRVAILENSGNLLAAKCDDNEQYSRRASLRINNIPLPVNGKESADQCMEKVKAVIVEAGVAIPVAFLDRTHRVGKSKVGSDGSVNQQMIVKFTTWHHRPMLYKGRKNLSHAKVYLDLTKSKFKLLKMSQEKVRNNEKVDFVFADVNCALCVRMSTGVFKYFNSQKQLDDILSEA